MNFVKLLFSRRSILLAALACSAGSLAGCKSGGGGSSSPPPGPAVVAPTIATQVTSATVTVGQAGIFSVTVNGTAPFSYQWMRNGTNISGATSSTYTTPATVWTDGGAKFTVLVSNSAGSVTSAPATLTVDPPQPVDVTTYHNDPARTGLNANEVELTQSNVKSATFGKVGFFPMDGLVDAEPLLLSDVKIPGFGTRDVVYAVSENDSVYAFDATTGQVFWQVSVLGAGETPSDDRGCSQVTPKIGITSTPVIDRTRGPNGAMYLIAMSKDSGGVYHQRIHALDITTGAELFGGPQTITATFPAPATIPTVPTSSSIPASTRNAPHCCS